MAELCDDAPAPTAFLPGSDDCLVKVGLVGVCLGVCIRAQLCCDAPAPTTIFLSGSDDCTV